MAVPPKIFNRLLRWFCASDLREEIEGDLEETFQYDLNERGAFFAKKQYAKEVFFLIRPSVIKQLKLNNSNSTTMFRNYTKVGLRNILKYKLFSFINIFGLAVAMSVCLLIILMLADQHEYDQFHTHKDRIYRVLTGHNDGNTTAATTPYSTLNVFNNDYPLAKMTTTLRSGIGGDVRHEDNFAQMIGYFADPDFFNLFSYELSRGNPTTALKQPNSMIISEEVALQLFGNDNPLGKVVDFTNRGLSFYSDKSRFSDQWGSFTVTGVIPINSYKSHLKFDVLISNSSLSQLYQDELLTDLTENWSDYYRTYNYILLDDAHSKEDLDAALMNLSENKFKPLEEMEVSYLTSQSMNDFRPGPLLNNAPTVSLPMPVYVILLILATVVLVLACLNYTNLSVARAITRAKEIGIRKVTGAKRKDLIFQFLSESIIISLFALLLATFLLYFLKSAFTQLWLNQFLDFDLVFTGKIYPIFIGFSLIVGVIAGIFPALRLSAYKPVAAIKGITQAGNTRMSLRKTLTVSQFAISLFFIITSFVIYNQFQGFMEHDYGFNTEQVLNINLQSNDFEKVKKVVENVPGVTGVAGCEYLPSTGQTESMLFQVEEAEEMKNLIAISASNEFIEVLDFKVVAGDLEKIPLTDKNSMVINKEAVVALGYDSPDQIIGESFKNEYGEYLKVAAVIDDFTFHLIFNGRSTSPVIIYNAPEKFTILNLAVNTSNKAAIIENLAGVWKDIDPIHPFQYEFYRDNLNENNQGLLDIANIIGFITFVAVVIASLGLLGIVIYTAERRSKEVGIRKILGAEQKNLIFILSKEFLILLVISILIATPIAYLFNNFWLDFLVVRTPFGLGTIFNGIALLLIIGIITIGSQTVKTALTNPVEALRKD